MKWTGDPERDSILSLVDDTGTAIYGQVTKDSARGWNGFDYTFQRTEWVGHFPTATEAQEAVAERVKASENLKGQK